MSNQGASLEIVNMAEFQAVFTRYMARTPRTLAKAMNTKMFYIARGASRYSPKANRSEIERELGVIGFKVATGKRGQPLRRKGKIRWNRVLSNTATVAAKIVNMRRGAAGKKGLYGAEMKAAINKLISRRVAAIGTVKAGWWNAIRRFGAAIGQTAIKDVNTARLKGVSRAKTARDGWNPEASVEYNVNSFDPEHRAYIDRRTRDGLARSYGDEMRSMEKHMIGELQKDADRMAMR